MVASKPATFHVLVQVPWINILFTVVMYSYVHSLILIAGVFTHGVYNHDNVEWNIRSHHETLYRLPMCLTTTVHAIHFVMYIAHINFSCIYFADCMLMWIELSWVTSKTVFILLYFIYLLYWHVLLIELDASIPCFRRFLSFLKQLNETDLEAVTLTYLRDDRLIARQLMVDALGALATNGSYDVMRNHVFLADKPESKLLERAFFQLVTIADRPSLVSVHIDEHTLLSP